MSEKLLPCPWCGGEARTWNTDNDICIDHKNNCGFKELSNKTPVGVTYLNTEADFNLWNTRAIPSQQGEILQEMENEIIMQRRMDRPYIAGRLDYYYQKIKAAN